jgi:hypothetical protein
MNCHCRLSGIPWRGRGLFRAGLLVVGALFALTAETQSLAISTGFTSSAGASAHPAPARVMASQAAQDAWCQQLSGRLRSVNQVFCRGLPFGVSAVRSSQGRALFVLDQPPASQPGVGGMAAHPARIFIIGGIHGDELTAVSIVVRWMSALTEAEASRYHWRIVPLANPDGLFARPSRRMNGRGVDLNRNFATPDWLRDAHAYWRQRTGQDPRRYPGKKPASEPEIQFLTAEIEAFQPDVIVSVHAPYGILDYDGPRQKPRRFGQLTLNQLGVYPGSLGNLGGIYLHIPVITIELSHASIMPSLTEQRQIWQDMLAWIAKNIAPPDDGRTRP